AADRSHAADYKLLAKDPDADVTIQAMLTMNMLKVADAPATIKAISAENQKKGVQLVATSLLNPNAGGRGGGLEGLGGRTFTPGETAALEKGGTVYKELCFSCHGDDGRGAPAPGGSASGTRAPARAA